MVACCGWLAGWNPVGLVLATTGPEPPHVRWDGVPLHLVLKDHEEAFPTHEGCMQGMNCGRMAEGG